MLYGKKRKEKKRKEWKYKNCYDNNYAALNAYFI
jgi:hypothetical protein